MQCSVNCNKEHYHHKPFKYFLSCGLPLLTSPVNNLHNWLVLLACHEGKVVLPTKLPAMQTVLRARLHYDLSTSARATMQMQYLP